ncbi:MAG TPA: cytochrome C biogenesis protein CcdA [Ktedonobacter sp.]|jgi:periplasmic divalent cation tolerance protein|nr:cytochrome C biogenesis protein CcdA [Ktedonobacter sp.]
MTDFLIILTNTNSKEEAQRIASVLVNQRLASSVNIIGPITSTYRWQDAIVNAEEWLCLIKTHKDRYNEIEQFIQATHSYEVPAIIALPVVAGSQSYLEWILHETKTGTDRIE